MMHYISCSLVNCSTNVSEIW